MKYSVDLSDEYQLCECGKLIPIRLGSPGDELQIEYLYSNHSRTYIDMIQQCLF